jgi:GcrA cell cycle regulator
MSTQEISLNWTADRVEKLKKLVAEGFSAGQISHRLNAGFTRNAVIGKVTRLGLSFARGNRQRTIRPGGIAARPTQTVDVPKRLRRTQGGIAKPTPRDPAAELRDLAAKRRAPEFNPEPYVPAVVELPAEPLNIGLLELEYGMCKFPTTAEAPHLFCGLPIVKGRPYCTSHTAACFVRGSYLPRSLTGKLA